jgi:hypothetical protein
MVLLLFFVGVMTAKILDRQAARQEAALREACERFGVGPPPPGPRLSGLEVALNLFLGLVLAGGSALALLVSFL